MENKKINYINILMALLVQVGITLLAVSLFSITMNLMDIDYKYSPVFGSVAVALGAFANAYFLSRKKKSKGYALGGAVGLITFIIITLIGLIIIGLGGAPIYPCVIHSTPENFGADKSQAIIGVQMASAYVGTCLMPPLFGVLANHINVALLPVYLLVLLALMIVGYEVLEKKTVERE